MGLPLGNTFLDKFRHRYAASFTHNSLQNVAPRSL